MFCEKCGTELPETSSFCPNCGARTAAPAEAATPPETAAPAETSAPAPRPAPINLDTVKASINNITAKTENKNTFGIVTIALLALTALLYIFQAFGNYDEMSAVFSMMDMGGYTVIFWAFALVLIGFSGFFAYMFFKTDKKAAFLWKWSLSMAVYTAVMWLGSLIWSTDSISGFDFSKFEMGMTSVFYSYTDEIIAINIILCIVSATLAYLYKKMDEQA